ncbi:MAG: DUF1835 domain-containing protein [Alphaproteobacteria bacterium]
MIHIRCGDDMRPAFEASGLAGEYVKCADPLCDGPTPADSEGAAWQAIRAGFASQTYDVPLAEAERFQTDQEAGLAKVESASEVVLWFEHDIFDQIILIFLLDRFARRPKPVAKLTLICIEGYPGIDEFGGLSQLGPDALRDLFANRAEITDQQTAVARRAWAAYRDADPRAIETLLGEDTRALPFLASALIRHLQDFPGLRDGLARTERQALLAVTDGPQSAEQVFAANQAMEEARWCGDTMYWAWLRRLARGRMPVLSITGPENWHLDRELAAETTIGPTRAGQVLLNGGGDWAKFAGIERWLGGVHLQGSQPAWRWDEARRRLVETL